MNITLRHVELKGSYHRFEADGMNGSVWFSKAAFADGKAPETVDVVIENVAPVKASKAVDPETLRKAAEKAEADASKKAARAAALRARLDAMTPAAQPAAEEPAAQPAAEEPAAPAAQPRLNKGAKK